MSQVAIMGEGSPGSLFLAIRPAEVESKTPVPAKFVPEMSRDTKSGRLSAILARVLLGSG